MAGVIQSFADWKTIQEGLFSQDLEAQSRTLHAIFASQTRLVAWQVEGTAHLIAIVQDIKCAGDKHSDQLHSRLAMALLRFISLASNASDADKSSLPPHLFQVRDDITNSASFPSFDFLLQHAEESLAWLKANYWTPILSYEHKLKQIIHSNFPNQAEKQKQLGDEIDFFSNAPAWSYELFGSIAASEVIKILFSHTSSSDFEPIFSQSIEFLSKADQPFGNFFSSLLLTLDQNISSSDDSISQIACAALSSFVFVLLLRGKSLSKAFNYNLNRIRKTTLKDDTRPQCAELSVKLSQILSESSSSPTAQASEMEQFVVQQQPHKSAAKWTLLSVPEWSAITPIGHGIPAQSEKAKQRLKEPLRFASVCVSEDEEQVSDSEDGVEGEVTTVTTGSAVDMEDEVQDPESEASMEEEQLDGNTRRHIEVEESEEEKAQREKAALEKLALSIGIF